MDGDFGGGRLTTGRRWFGAVESTSNEGAGPLRHF